MVPVPVSAADIVIADTRAAAMAPELGAAARDRRTALLCVVTDEDGADAAFAAGATHVSIGAEPDALRRALRFAGRYASRLGRGTARQRSRYGRVPTAIAAALARRGEASTLIIVALPRFAVVNAAFGRDAGDALLAEVQRRMETALGPAAPVVRRDGAEFLAVTTREEATSLVSASMEQPFPIDGVVTTLGHRIAVARRAPDEDAGALLYRANQALANAKDDGAQVHSLDVDDASFAVDLHRAIDRAEISVLFQPQASMATGEIVGVEALARWEHPRAGVIGADALFAAAARADLEAALSDHVQTLALTRAANWPVALAHLKLSINVSAADIARSDFVDRLLARIDAAGLARARVTIELTESGFIGDLDRTAGLLARLRGAGCRIAIDDFGTGYSSLAYLKALPIDYLKIDKSLVADAAGPARDRALVRAVIAIARSLGLETIAEGVETKAQRDALAHDGCGIMQGFLCAPPLDDAALIAKVEGK